MSHYRPSEDFNWGELVVYIFVTVIGVAFVWGLAFLFFPRSNPTQSSVQVEVQKPAEFPSAADYAEDTDILTCPKCRDEVVNPLCDQEAAAESTVTIVPMSNLMDVFGLNRPNKKEGK